MNLKQATWATTVVGAVGPLGPYNVPHTAICRNCGAAISFLGEGGEETTQCLCGNQISTQVKSDGTIKLTGNGAISLTKFVPIVRSSAPATSEGEEQVGAKTRRTLAKISAREILAAYDAG